MRIAWILFGNSCQPEVINQVNELQMPRQKPFKQMHTPLFKRFWQDSMIGIRESVINNVPRGLLIEMFLVDHDSEQFNNTQRGMGVIELDGSLVGEVLPVKLALILLAVGLVTTNDVLKGGGY